MAFELRHDRAQSVDSTEFLRDVLPREKEPHEVGSADRLDFRAKAVERVSMDAREQTPVAPVAISAQHHALGFELQQRRFRLRFGDVQ